MTDQREDTGQISDEPSSEDRRTRSLEGALGAIVRIVSIVLSIYVALYVSTLLDLLGFQLYGSNRALVYGGIVFLLFMLYPATAKGPWDRVPWYDLVLATLGVGASLYAFFSWNKWSYGIALPTWQEEALAVALIIVSLEGARRVLGWAFAAVGAAFIIYPLIGHDLPGIFATPVYSLSQLTQFFYLAGGGSGVFGTPMEIFTTTVAIFLLFGAFLQQTGAGAIFIDAALGVAGRYRGGMAKVAVVSSSLFGLISGVGAANVLVTGAFTIPAMKRLGYRPAFAAAVEAAASTGGILMPPVMGAAAFLMADILGLSYWSIAAAAFIPALLYYIAMFTMVDFEAGRSGLRGIPPSEIPRLPKTLLRGWHLIAAVAVLLVLMGYFGHPVDQSALIALLVLVVLSMLPGKGLRPPDLFNALDNGGRLLAEIGAAGAIVGIIMSGFTLTGLGGFLPTAMQALSGNSLFLLLLFAAAASVILGMGAPPLLVYVLLAATVAPTIIKFGVPPLAAHMFIFYFGLMSMLTPPVALSSLIAARVARSGFWQTSVEAVRLAIVAFIIPFFFVYQPSLLLQGATVGIVIAIATALVGVVALGGALSRFLFIRKLRLLEAAVLGMGGLLLLYPGHVSDIIGVVLIAPSICGTGFILVRRRRKDILLRSTS